LAATPTDPIALRSPFNGEVIQMTFLDGMPPTLERMLAAGYVRVDPPKTTAPKPRKE
jgi:hypothetical protein